MTPFARFQNVHLWLLLVINLLWVGCQANTAVSPTDEQPADAAEVAQAEPTVVPTLAPTDTAVPPTHTPQPTPLPPTESPLPTEMPEPAKITALPELVGYWEYYGFQTNAGGALQYVFRFRADGVLEIGDSRRAIESGDIKARADFWFAEGEWRTQLVSGFWRNNTCFSGSDKPLTGRYEIRSEESGVLRFFRTIDRCQNRTSLSDNDAILTPIAAEDVDWFVDVETGLPLNPDPWLENGRFVLAGTLLSFGTGDEQASLVTVRLPTGQVVEIMAPPQPEIQIDAPDFDLAGYDPDYPVRARLVVQTSEDGLRGEVMMVMTALK